MIITRSVIQIDPYAMGTNCSTSYNTSRIAYFQFLASFPPGRDGTQGAAHNLERKDVPPWEKVAQSTPQQDRHSTAGGDHPWTCTAAARSSACWWRWRGTTIDQGTRLL